MDLILTTSEAARLLRISSRTVSINAKAGVYKHAAKVGGRWYINLAREYPQLFGQKEGPQAKPTAKI